MMVVKLIVEEGGQAPSVHNWSGSCCNKVGPGWLQRSGAAGARFMIVGKLIVEQDKPPRFICSNMVGAEIIQQRHQRWRQRRGSSTGTPGGNSRRDDDV